jgi:transposase
VISVALFQTIQEWHDAGVEKREIARRLQLDIKTVRRQIRRIEAGAVAPARTSPGSKLDAYAERIAELAASGWTAWSIHVALREDPNYTASYELVKKRVASLRRRDPRVYERLEHLPGAEMQADFGELVRVHHQGHLVRVWAYVAVWPHSRYRYAEVVLDQSMPTFLAAMQNGIFAAQAIPQRISIDNLAAAVLREHFHERGYQREFSAFCKHFGTLPNAVRPRTPTDKGAVENGVGVLKRALRGRTFGSLEELQRAVTTIVDELNARPSALDHRRPNDLIVQERSNGGLPERFPIAAWSEHRVRTDCHVQVRSNFYSVPYTLVGKVVVVRVDSSTITVYDDFAIVARHERWLGRGKTITDRSHYPEHKRKASQEVHRERVDQIRSVGAGAAAFYAGLLQSRDHVHSDSYRALLKLIETTPATDLDRACARAAHFGNFSLDALRRIIDGRLFDRPLDDLSIAVTSTSSQLTAVRRLEAYTELFGGWPC